jgi:hypothetical protein
MTDEERFYREAARHRTLLNMMCENKKAFYLGRRLGLIEKAFGSKRVRWDEPSIKRLALSCESRREMQIISHGAHAKAVALGIADALFGNRENAINKKIVTDRANQCRTKAEFSKRFPAERSFAESAGIIDDLFKFHCRTITDEELFREAIKFKDEKELKERCTKLYNVAEKRKLLDVIFAPRRMRSWTEEDIISEAAKFKTKAEFQRGSFNAYQAAKRFGLIDELFENVGSFNTRDCIYVWETNEGSGIFKVGVTSENLGSSRIFRVAHSGGFDSPRVVILRKVGYESAKKLEREIKGIGRRFVPPRRFDGSSELRRMTASQLDKAVSMIESLSNLVALQPAASQGWWCNSGADHL